MCWPPIGLCRALAIPFLWTLVVVMSAVLYRAAEDGEQRSEARATALIGGAGIPVLTVLSLADLFPGPFEPLVLGLFDGLGYVGLFFLGPMALSGLLVGLGIITAAISRELIAEYA
ncbi:hypothetical protein [Halosimplex halobium]|uniref:hypothetical protein n=1 Tax=Halosimplex halobium TaxID=3396618 RepID=UPI003F562D7C